MRAFGLIFVVIWVLRAVVFDLRLGQRCVRPILFRNQLLCLSHARLGFGLLGHILMVSDERVLVSDGVNEFLDPFAEVFPDGLVKVISVGLG